MFTKIKNICRYCWLLPENGEGKEEGREGGEGIECFWKGGAGCVLALSCCPCGIWGLGEEEPLHVALAFLGFFSVLYLSAVFLPNYNGGKGANRLFLSKSKKGARFVPVRSGTVLNQLAFIETLNSP